MKKVVLSVAGALLVFSAVPSLTYSASAPSFMQQETKQETKTFSGTIKKDGSAFVLVDPANKFSYLLDDAQKASQYEGKKVKVTGTVDVASNTLHVETIQELA